MFLQLVVAGHLLLFICRHERWFWERPHPSWKLLCAIITTQLLAVVICLTGFLVPAIGWDLILLVWVQAIIWMFLLNIARRALPLDAGSFPQGVLSARKRVFSEMPLKAAMFEVGPCLRFGWNKKRSLFREKQMIGVIKEQESGVLTTGFCRKHGIMATRFINTRSNTAAWIYQARAS